jgi:hypothetical protein
MGSQEGRQQPAVGRIVPVDQVERRVKIGPEGVWRLIATTPDRDELKAPGKVAVVTLGAIGLQHGLNVPGEYLGALQRQRAGQVEDHRQPGQTHPALGSAEHGRIEGRRLIVGDGIGSSLPDLRVELPPRGHGLGLANTRQHRPGPVVLRADLQDLLQLFLGFRR